MEPLEIYDRLKAIVGEDHVIRDRELMYRYARDFTEHLDKTPLAVVKPATTNEVATVAKICSEYHVGITVRGGGTGVSGGAFCEGGGIVLSLERLNQIIEINKIDRYAVVEAGTITRIFQEKVLEEGLCFPQNISSRDSSSLGGNIAVAGGSPKSFKYGPIKNYLLNLEVVLPNGQVMWTGKNVRKNATGYDLTRLFAGSEGTLGIITKVVVQLVEPMEEVLLLLPFRSMDNLFNFVREVFWKGIRASSVEFMDKTGYELISAFTGGKIFSDPCIEGLLWLEFEGDNKSQLLKDVLEMNEWMSCWVEEDILIAESAEDIKALWIFRNKIGEAVMHSYYFRDVDIVVPRSKSGEMYSAIKAIAEVFDLKYTAFGHIGDGNFHVNLLRDRSVVTEQWEHLISLGVSEIFNAAVRLGGTISGEHGIGEIQQPYLTTAIPAWQIQLMREVKKVFDPLGILNPGKIFQSSI